jgi:hypothetical protein
MCPKCRSVKLKIKPAKGCERILVLFTGKRKFLCVDCGLDFRAPDRRRVPREIRDGHSAERARDAAFN